MNIATRALLVKVVAVAVLLAKKLKPSISIIIPLLNEADNVANLITSLSQILFDEESKPISNKSDIEIIMVDGGSRDTTVSLLKKFTSGQIILSEACRAKQMNEGAKRATGDVLIFLHADTLLPRKVIALLQNNFWESNKAWGRFDVRINGKHGMFWVIAYMMNVRSKLSGICTGDQTIFVRKKVFESLSGYAPVPLMEDIEISQRLKKISAPYCIKEKVITSSRRWEHHGIIRTIVTMWQLRLLYFMGISPKRLHQKYYGSSSP